MQQTAVQSRAGWRQGWPEADIGAGCLQHSLQFNGAAWDRVSCRRCPSSATAAAQAQLLHLVILSYRCCPCPAAAAAQAQLPPPPMLALRARYAWRTISALNGMCI